MSSIEFLSIILYCLGVVSMYTTCREINPVYEPWFIFCGSVFWPFIACYMFFDNLVNLFKQIHR